MKGLGTEKNPFLVETFEDFKKVGRGEVDGGNYSEKSYYTMISDIDASDTQSESYESYEYEVVYDDLGSGEGGYGLEIVDDKGWSPIRNFKGVFDGGGYTIDNLYINRPETEDVGLFGYIDQEPYCHVQPEVKNLQITNFDITGGDYSGAIAGRTRRIISTDCYLQGKINGGESVGGAFGFSDKSDANNIEGSVNVKGTKNNVGGLFGRILGGRTTKCFCSGSVEGVDNVGGVIGESTSDFSIFDSGSEHINVLGHKSVGGFMGGTSRGGFLKNNHSIGNVEGEERVGGFIGGDNPNIISNPNTMNCNFKGTVKGEKEVGGFAGYLSRTSIDCYSESEVYGEVETGGFCGRSGPNSEILRGSHKGVVLGTNMVGGLVGSSFGKVSYSYFMGDVKGHKDIGGIAGYSEGEGLRGEPREGSEIFRCCVLNSSIEGEGVGSANVGGLIGRASISTCIDSFVFATIKGNTIGGLIGHNWDSYMIENCYMVGNMSGNYVSGSVRVPHRTPMSVSDPINVSNSYFNKTTTGLEHPGESKTTVEMNNEETYESWDFGSVWYMGDKGYPFLWGLPEDVTEHQLKEYEPLEFEEFKTEWEHRDYTDVSHIDFDEVTGTVLGYLNEGPGNLVIPVEIDGVEVVEIGDYALGWVDLTSVVMPDGLIEIGEGAFLGNNLISIVIPDSITSICNYSFESNQLRSVVMPSSVTEIGDWAFSGNELTEVVIPDSVTEISRGVFAYNRFKEITIPNSVTHIGDMAFRDNFLTSIEIPENIIEIGYGAFANNDIKEATLYSVAPDNYKLLLYRATKLTIGDNITSIPDELFGGFRDSDGNRYDGILEELTLGDNVTEIGKFAFSHNKLPSVVLPEGLVTIGEGAFYRNELATINIPDSVIEIGRSSFSSNPITELVIPNNVTYVGSGAFFGNPITNLTLGDNITEIGGRAFEGSELTELVLPNNLAVIDTDAFFGNQLTEIVIPDSVTNLSGFRDNQLTKIVIPDSVVEINRFAFADNDLTEAIIGNSVVEIGYGAFMLNPLTKIIIPDSVSKIGGNAFQNNQLTEVVIPDSIIEIGSGAFGHSNQLTEVVLSEGLVKIGSSAFIDNQLTSIEIPDSVIEIGYRAFMDNEITTIKIPANVHLTLFSNDDLFGQGSAFKDYYEANGSQAGTYTRPDYESTDWQLITS